MKRLGLMVFLFSILCVSIGHADLLKPQPFQKDQNISSLSTRAYARQFKPGESAFAQVYGKGNSSLILYVFDAKGNCVAWDDNITSPQYCDENAVEWISDSAGQYSVEVRNVGMYPHVYTLTIR